jgi:hypothetical protein
MIVRIAPVWFSAILRRLIRLRARLEFRPDESLTYFAKTCSDLFCIGNVRRNCQRIRSKFIGETVNEPWRTREHSNATAFLDELAHKRRPESGPNPSDNRDAFFGHVSHGV